MKTSFLVSLEAMNVASRLLAEQLINNDAMIASQNLTAEHLIENKGSPNQETQPCQEELERRAVLDADARLAEAAGNGLEPDDAGDLIVGSTTESCTACG